MADDNSCAGSENVPFRRHKKGEEIVITGMAGNFPDSHNIHHFRDNLFNKVDLVSGDYRRWRPIHPEVPQRTGKLYDIEKFDPGFFGVAHVQSHHMDPMIRLVLERTYEAIIDAGYTPEDFAGTNTAVIDGVCFSETENSVLYDCEICDNDAITGSQRSMGAGRISYYLKTKGPAYTTDTACSSSMFALQEGYRQLLEGRCDKAIIAGSHLCLHPIVSLQFARLGVLSPDGSCKSFDNSGNGYARSEGIVVIILEKAKDAKRIYAEVVHCKTNCDGHKKEGITFPSSDAQTVLMKEFYEEIQVDPSTLTYLEAHGTGTKVGDPEELRTLDEIFCKGRSTPLHIGTIKSNIGHNEPVSGLCSVIKVLIGMETGCIPPNINYDKPREGVEGLEKGRMIVVTEKTPIPDDRGLFGINSFGFGGANGHVLLHWNTKIKVNEGIPNDKLPRLICIHARNEEGVTSILDDVKSRPLDVEHVYLIQQAFRKQLDNNIYRGYGVFTKEKEVKRSVKRINIETPKLYLVFSNFEKEFLKLGHRLKELPTFSNTIESIQNILNEAADLDLSEVIKNSADENLINQILGTVAIQISLVNVLKSIKLIPDRIVGVGSGELVAGYADNYLTLKQVVLGIFCVTSNLKNENNKNWEALEKILPNKKNSYEKWIPGHEEKLLQSSPKYFSDNIITNGRNAKQLIPKEALSLVIGADVKELSGEKILLTDVNSNDPVVDLLSSLGSLYELGFEMELNKLYPTIELPVSRGTPMLSPLVKWQSADCNVYLHKNQAEVKSGHRVVHIIPKTEDWAFVTGHVIDGRNLFPATGYLNLVWESLAMISGKLLSEMKIVFEDVKYIRAANIPKDGSLELMVFIQMGTQTFEVIEGGVAIVTGKVYEKTDEQTSFDIPVDEFDESKLCMDQKDVYKELKLRGYHYTGLFKGIRKCNVDASQGIIHWDCNWIAFMDCLLQMVILQSDTRNIYVPTSIAQLTIDALPSTLRTSAIEVRSLGARVIGRKKGGDPVLEISKFIANNDHRDISESVKIFAQIVLENTSVLKVKVVEACPPEFEETGLLSPMIQQALDDLPSIQQDITVLTNKSIDLSRISVQNKPLSTESHCLMLVVTKVLETTETSVALNAVKAARGYIISREDLESDLSKFNGGPFSVICSHSNDKEFLVLLKPIVQKLGSNTAYVNLTNALDDFQWVPRLQEQIKNSDRVVLYSQGEEISGLLGLSTCLQREPSGSKISAFLIIDEAPKFNPDLDFYRKQLDKNMAINVWKDGVWGTYRHLLLPENQPVENEHTYVNVTSRGDLSSLTWLEGNVQPDKVHLEYDKELIRVYYSALNFRDLMTASGKISPDAITRDRIEQECVQGFEFAGRNSKGQRVMGMCTNGALASIVLCDNRMIYPIPDEWTMEDASSAVVVYFTVLNAFENFELVPGKSILIHSATGGIGLAALNLCSYYGLELFVTVGTQEKIDFLRKHYPNIKEEHIGSSRDTSFETMIHQRTNGRGVDYVLNSLAEEKLLASVRCLARGGRFVEIGKFDLASNNALALNLLEKDAEFIGMALDRCFKKYNFSIHGFNNQFFDLVKRGGVKPLPRTIFKPDEVEQAFRYMGQGKHIGKVIIKLRNEEDDRVIAVPRTLFKANPRCFCQPSCSYLICGGLGGFGMELADLLVLRGAKNLILTSRSGLCNGYQKYRIKVWKTYGVNVLTTSLEASTEESCAELLNIANDLAPLDGIFNLAAVLKDVLFENHTEEGFKRPLIPKAHCTKNLDSISRKLCPSLRYFVVFSSISCGRGNSGQTNYGMANSVMERICEKRKREGYHALAIQWGAIGEVGLVAKMQEDHRELIIGGTLQQRTSSCLQVMDKLLKQDEPIVGSMLVAEKRYGGRADNLFDAILNIMGVSNLKSVSMHSTFPELGMDSMMGVEIKQSLEREYEVFLTAQDIRGMTLAKLKDLSNCQEIEIVMSKPIVQTELPETIDLILRYIGSEEMSTNTIVLPGLEGMAAMLEPLCEKLEAHVSCLQFCPGMKVESISQLASSILPYVGSVTGDLIIIAYSFGCVVAAELLYMLEAKGKLAKVIFVDGSLEILQRMVKSIFPSDDENLFRTIILSSLMMRYMPYDHVVNQREHVMKLSTYKEKIDYMVKVAPYSVDVSIKYITEMCISTYEKLSALYKYKIREDKLKSNLTFFKASSSVLANVGDDHGLSNTFENLENVITIEGNHVTILKNEQLANEINKILRIA